MAFSTKVDFEHRVHRQMASVGIIALDSAKELGEKVDKHLQSFYQEKEPHPDEQHGDSSFLIDAKCPRFQSGDGKGIINQSVRGLDLYILADVGNYSCTYKMFGKENCMSPDDHFADIKRIIGAVGGKAYRVTVIMPFLYGARQHRRSYRESLDCATALQELQAMGVSSILTFDAHDPRVVNAVPLMSLDSAMPYYQILKALFKKYPDLVIDKETFMMCSPDEGAINRNIFFASTMGVDMGMYYKRRDYSRIVNGRNPIVAHEYLGNSVEGKTVMVYDDQIASGDSMLDIAYDMKKRGAAKVFCVATYALFTDGIDKFNKAYEDGVLDGVLSTNLTYRRPELLAAPWYIEADLSKYVAYFIASLNHNMSVTSVLDPYARIQKLLEQHRSKQSSQLEIQ